MSEEKTQAEQIIGKCLEINDCLMTVKKSLEVDGQNIDGFSDHYSDLIQQILDINWQNHDLAYELSRFDWQLDRIRELLDK